MSSHPSARGGIKSHDRKTGTQCGAYGWWQEFLKHNNNQQQHVGWPVADCKAIQKSSPFGKRTPLNVQLSHSGQQADSGSAPCHHTVHNRWDHVLEGSAHLTMGDTRGDMETQHQFPPKADDPEREGTTTSLSQKSGHLKNEGATDLADRGEESVLCSELFVVPGAQNIIRVLKAPNFVWSAWCTEPYKSAWGTLGLMCHIIVLDLTRSDHFIFFHSFVLLPHSKLELGYYYFLWV